MDNLFYTKTINLPESYLKRNPRVIFKLIFFYLLWLGSAAAIYMLLNSGNWTAVLAAVVLSFATGFFLCAGIGFIGHDIAHGSVVSGTKIMQWGTFASLTMTLFVPYHLWNRWHNTFHHRYVNTAKDSDRLVRLTEIESGLVSYPVYMLMNRMGLSLQYVAARMWQIIYGSKTLSDKKKRSDVISLLLVLIIYAGLFIILPFSLFALAVALPVFVGLVTVSLYIQSNHFLRPQTETPDQVQNSSDVSVPRILNYFHSNFSSHTAHHLYPFMASKHYIVVQTKIREQFANDYHTIPFYVSIWKNLTLPRIVDQNKYLVTRSGQIKQTLR
jgi:fatty acid desaturase